MRLKNEGILELEHSIVANAHLPPIKEIEAKLMKNKIKNFFKLFKGSNNKPIGNSSKGVSESEGLFKK